MKVSIKKLMKEDMNLHQLYLCFNTCFFGCGIVKFSKKKFDELNQTYEQPTIRKMILRDNLPSKLLYVRKPALEVGLIEPKIVIDYLAIKLHVGNKISTGELKSVINTHEEIVPIYSGLPNNVRGKEAKIRYWKEGWIEETG